VGHGVAPREVVGHPHRPHGALHGVVRRRGDGPGDPPRPFHEGLLRHHLGDQAQLMGAGGRHALVRAEQGHAQRLAQGELLQEMHRLEARHHAVGDVGVEEGGVLRRDDDVGLPEHVEGAAAGHAVDRSHHRLPHVVLLRVDEDAGVVVHEGRPDGPGRDGVGILVRRQVVLGDRLVAVDPGAEGLVARPGQDHDAHVAVPAQTRPQLAQLPLHPEVEGVVLLGAVQGHGGDAVVLLVEKRLEVGVHLPALPGRPEVTPGDEPVPQRFRLAGADSGSDPDSRPLTRRPGDQPAAGGRSCSTCTRASSKLSIPRSGADSGSGSS